MNGYRKLSLLYLVSSVVAVAGASNCATVTFAAGPQGANGSVASPNYPLAYGEQQTCLYRFLFSPAETHYTACFTFLKIALSGADSLAFLANGSQFLAYSSGGLLYDAGSGVTVEKQDGVVRLTRRTPLCLTFTSSTALALLLVAKQRTNAMDEAVFYATFVVRSPYDSNADAGTLQSPTWCMFGKKETTIGANGGKAESCVQQRCNADNVDNSVFQCADQKLCLDSRARCDRVPHCEDDSDELNCRWSFQCSFGTWEVTSRNKKCAAWSWEPVISQELDLGLSKTVSHTAGSGSLMLRASTKQRYIVAAFSAPLAQRMCLQFWFQVRSANTHSAAFMGLVEHVKSSDLSKRVLWLWNVAQPTDGWQSAHVEVASQAHQSILLVYMNSNSEESHVEFYYDDVSEALGKCGDEQAMVDCTFERSMCGWSDSQSVWKLTSMTHATLPQGTLPLSDHTTSVLAGADADTKYLPQSGYILSLSSSRLSANANASAELVSVPLLRDVTHTKCLRFWFVCSTAHKRADCATLVVTQQYDDQHADADADASVAFRVLLPAASDWQQKAVELRALSRPYRLHIAYQWTEREFEIALDDVQLAHASCHAHAPSVPASLNVTATADRVDNSTQCPFRCPSSDDVNCLLPNHFCDGVIDCPDGSDEYSCESVQLARTDDAPKRDVITYTVSLAIVVCGSFIVFVIVSVFWVRAKLQRHRQQRASQLEMFAYPFSDSRNSLHAELDPPPYWSLIGAEADAPPSTRANYSARKCNAPSPDDDGLPPYEAVAHCAQSL